MMFLKIYLGIGVMYSIFLVLNFRFHFIKGNPVVDMAYMLYDEVFTFEMKLASRLLEIFAWPFIIGYNTYHILKGDLFE